MTTPVTIKVYRGDDLVRTERFSRDIIKIGRLSSATLPRRRQGLAHPLGHRGGRRRLAVDHRHAASRAPSSTGGGSEGLLSHGDEKLGGRRIVLDGDEANGSAAAGQATASAAAVPALPEDDHAGAQGESGEAPGGLVAVMGAGGAGAAAAAVAISTAPEEAPAPARRHRPALALATSVDDEPAEEGAADLGVEMRVLWGDTLLDAGTFVAPREPVLVGDGPRCHFRLSGPDLPSDAFPMLRHDAGEYRFLFVGGMGGGLIDGTSLRPFAELVKSRAASPDDLVDGAYRGAGASQRRGPGRAAADSPSRRFCARPSPRSSRGGSG
jgi:hypothetical protein